MWLKNMNTKNKNNNTRCVKLTWKHIFIILTYATWTWKEHDKVMV